MRLFDPISNSYLDCSIIGNIAVMYSYETGKRIEEEIRPADLSMARCCIAKKDLEGFASFFNRKEVRRAA